MLIQHCEPALRADLQRYFGIDFDDVEEEAVSVVQAASCAAYLPPDGAVACALNNQTPVWGNELIVLADMANSLRWLVWAKTKDGQKNRNKPEMIEPPRAEGEKPVAYDIETINEILSRKRR